MKALVIIDVQDTFCETDKSFPNRDLFSDIKQSLLNAIKSARDNGDLIIIVLYENYGAPSAFVKNAIRGYHNKYNVEKSNDDGSSEVHAKLNKLKFSGSLDICGVNTSQCVLDTICGLSDIGWCVNIIPEACMDYCKDSYSDCLKTHDDAIKYIKEYIGVRKCA